jgi:hypothetical protein
MQGLPFSVQEVVDAAENCLAGRPLEEPLALGPAEKPAGASGNGSQDA